MPRDMVGQIWGVQSLRSVGMLDTEESMRMAYVDCLLAFAQAVREGKPMLRVLEVSLHLDEEDVEGAEGPSARVRMKGFESDADYDYMRGRRAEVEADERRVDEVNHAVMTFVAGLPEVGGGVSEEEAQSLNEMLKAWWEGVCDARVKVNGSESEDVD